MPKRQVVFIMTDTQRKDMIGCYGNPDMKTPNLDRMASEGIRFERAYCCQPVCGPARSAIFTGTFPHTNGSWGNSMPLGETIKTVGQRLTDQGIHSAYIGKWHLDGGDYFGMGRCPDGWDSDYWYDMRNYLEELSEKDRLRSRDPKTNEDANLRAEFTFAHRCSNRALDFLEKSGDEDFLLVVSYDEPHHPWLCPRPYSQMYEGYELPKRPNVWDTLEDKPEHHRVWAGQRKDADRDAVSIQQPYFFGCNSFVDAEIGRVLEAVDRHAPEALVIYTADHGDAMESHCISNKGPAMYDEITNVPFIARWPGQAPEGAVCHHPVTHIDIVPTIMDVMGLSVPNTVEGKTMQPTLHSPEERTNDAVFLEFARYEVDHDGFMGFQPIRACFDGRYKFVVNLLTSDELYDLNEDPYEMKNLINSCDHTAIRDRLHDRLIQWMDDTRDPFRGYYWERRPWRTDAPPATLQGHLMTRQREEDERYEPRQLNYGTGLSMNEAVRKK